MQNDFFYDMKPEKKNYLLNKIKPNEIFYKAMNKVFYFPTVLNIRIRKKNLNKLLKPHHFILKFSKPCVTAYKFVKSTTHLKLQALNLQFSHNNVFLSKYYVYQTM